MGFTPEDPEFDVDVELAAELVGKRLLVGLTYLNPDGEPIEHLQVHGRVLRATGEEGVILALERSGEEFALPPMLDAYSPAQPENTG